MNIYIIELKIRRNVFSTKERDDDDGSLLNNDSSLIDDVDDDDDENHQQKFLKAPNIYIWIHYMKHKLAFDKPSKNNFKIKNLTIPLEAWSNTKGGFPF